MVALTQARGVEAVVGDVQNLPFRDGIFDCAVAAWMLYHVQDLNRALLELEPGSAAQGRLVATTNSGDTLPELWDLLGGKPRLDLQRRERRGSAAAPLHHRRAP